MINTHNDMLSDFKLTEKSLKVDCKNNQTNLDNTHKEIKHVKQFHQLIESKETHSNKLLDEVA